jgi:creatinine amidohydrolase
MTKVFWQEHTWKELKDIIPGLEAVLIPVGSTEQHGPHLPLWNDTYTVTMVCEGAAKRLYPRLLVAPTISLGYSALHFSEAFPGTLSLRPETLTQILCDLGTSFRLYGIRQIVIVNGHGGNGPSIAMAASRMRVGMGLRVGYVNYWELIPPKIYRESLEKAYPSARHAGEFETSIALAYYPHLVRRDYLATISEGDLGEVRSAEDLDDWKPRISQVLYTDEHRPSGFSDDPRLASERKGRIFVEAAIDGLTAALEDFLAFKPRLSHKKPRAVDL